MVGYKKRAYNCDLPLVRLILSDKTIHAAWVVGWARICSCKRQKAMSFNRALSEFIMFSRLCGGTVYFLCN